MAVQTLQLQTKEYRAVSRASKKVLCGQGCVACTKVQVLRGQKGGQSRHNEGLPPRAREGRGRAAGNEQGPCLLPAAAPARVEGDLKT